MIFNIVTICATNRCPERLFYFPQNIQYSSFLHSEHRHQLDVVESSPIGFRVMCNVMMTEYWAQYQKYCCEEGCRWTFVTFVVYWTLLTLCILVDMLWLFLRDDGICCCRRSRSRSSSRDEERAKREQMHERRLKGLPPFKEEHLISKLCTLLQVPSTSFTCKWVKIHILRYMQFSYYT